MVASVCCAITGLKLTAEVVMLRIVASKVDCQSLIFINISTAYDRRK